MSIELNTEFPALRQILVLEPKWTGHYPMFASLVADALRTTAGKVTLSLTRATRDVTGGIPDFAEIEVADRVEVRRSLGVIPSGYCPLTEAGGSEEWSAVENEIQALNPDLVVVPSADAICCARETPMKVRRFGIPIAGCMHNARLGYRGRGPRFLLRREWMRWRMRRCGMTLGTVDPVAVDSGKSIPLHLLPLPIANRGPTGEKPGLIRELEDRIAGRRMILAIGEHSRRKATDRIVASWPDPAPKDAVLVIAGRRSAEVVDAIQARRHDVEAGWIIDIDRTLSTPEFDGLLARADVVTAVYQGHIGVSGVVIEAAATGTAVLGCMDGGIGRTIVDHGLGAVIPNNQQALAKALVDVSKENPDVDELKRSAFIDSCRGDALERAWREFIEISVRS